MLTHPVTFSRADRFRKARAMGRHQSAHSRPRPTSLSGTGGQRGVGTRSALGVLFEEFHRVAHGENRFRGVIGNLAAEFLFERHDEFDRIEAVGAEIIDEARGFSNLVGLDAQMFHDDLLHPLANVTHRSNLVRLSNWLNPPSDLAINDPRSPWCGRSLVGRSAPSWSTAEGQFQPRGYATDP